MFDGVALCFVMFDFAFVLLLYHSALCFVRVGCCVMRFLLLRLFFVVLFFVVGVSSIF